MHSETTPPPADRPAPTAGAAAVLADIAAGAEPLTFKQVAKLKYFRREGRHRHVAAVYRAAGDDPPLESAVIAGVKISTEPAVQRYLARKNGIAAGANWTPGRFRREHQAAAKALAADGF